MTQKQKELAAHVKSQLTAIISERQWDIEQDHVIADKLLCDLLTALGQQEIVDLYDKVDKWYA
jgi:hypothetical protein